MTSYSEGLLVNWSRRGRGKATLNGKASLGKKAALGRKLAF